MHRVISQHDHDRSSFDFDTANGLESVNQGVVMSVRRLLLVGVTAFYSGLSLAYDQLPGDKYFLIQESTSNSVEGSLAPVSVIQFLGRQSQTEVNLLNWEQYNSAPPRPTEKYVRRKHFGNWIDYPHDTSCLRTRGLVLSRDSKVPVEMSPKNPCTVARGLWFDPYTKQDYESAGQVEIDHMVPLKDAYISGGFRWPWRLRCAYFNYLGNAFHLLPVEGNANRQKSDSGPELWMPANREYHCEYLANWLRIKAIWQLMLSEDEVRAISQMVQELRCDPSQFKLSVNDIHGQRDLMEKAANECPGSPSEIPFQY